MLKQPYLLLSNAKGNHCSFPLVGAKSWTIGRSQKNNIIIKEPWISRSHALLQMNSAKDFYLVDLGSRNGTFVNGLRISIPVILKDKYSVSLGKTQLEFHHPQELSLINKPKKRVNFDTTTQTLHVRRLMSVLVIDIRNYTKLATELDENILCELIGTWFRRAGKIIRLSGSWVDKYIGDAIMAVWFHAENQIHTAQFAQILAAVIALNKMSVDLNQKYTLPIDLRIGAGINTGYGMVGNTGSMEHPDYTAIGDTVNLAFRLESSTKILGVDLVVAKSTYNHLLPLAPIRQCFKEYHIKLKGYDGIQTVYGAKFQELEPLLRGEIWPLLSPHSPRRTPCRT